MPLYNLLDFRASGDGKALDTLAIQSAIEACHAAGGGTVIFPAGNTTSVPVPAKGFCIIRQLDSS